MQLTKKVIDGFKFDGKKKQDIRWDSKLKGFGVRIYPTGGKSFVLSYRVNRRKHIIVIGRYGIFTLDQARKKANKTLVDIQDGNDPSSQRRNAQRNKFASFAEIYLERYAKVRKKTWREDESRIRRHILPVLEGLALESITREDVADIHHNIGKTRPYEANRVLKLISKIINFAIEYGSLPEGHVNPACKVKPFDEQSRDRYITQSELPRLTKAIDNAESFHAKKLIWLYLLTGARKTELLQAKWCDLDLKERVLTIPDTKSKRPHYIQLSQPAVDLLSQLPEEEGNPYIFPGKKPGTHLTEIRRTWNKIRNEAGLQDVRGHDLRRTVGSWLAQSGSSLHLIGTALNHSDPETTKVYARFQRKNLQQAMDDYGADILKYSGGER
jgi:integrase